MKSEGLYLEKDRGTSQRHQTLLRTSGTLVLPAGEEGVWLWYLTAAPHRCWFGKEPGDLVDFIYQGPIILVLLVGAMGRWGMGHG